MFIITGSLTRILHSRDVDENKTESDLSESFTHAESITAPHLSSQMFHVSASSALGHSLRMIKSEYVSFSVKKTNQQVKKLKQVLDLCILLHFSIINTCLPHCGAEFDGVIGATPCDPG